MPRVRSFNIHTGELDRESSRAGYSWRATRVGEHLGAERIGASVYELSEQQQTFPYHFHHGIEEWLYVIDGTPTVRTQAGTQTLQRGDVICFPASAEGAHAVRGPGRVLIISADHTPSIAVYPDSDKLGTRPAGGADRLNFRRADAVEYWEGESA